MGKAFPGRRARQLRHSEESGLEQSRREPVNIADAEVRGDGGERRGAGGGVPVTIAGGGLLGRGGVIAGG